MEPAEIKTGATLHQEKQSYESKVLISIFEAIGQLDLEFADRIVEKEKEFKQSNLPFWSRLMSLLTNFINAERNYVSLNFLKYSVRKETYRQLHEKATEKSLHVSLLIELLNNLLEQHNESIQHLFLKSLRTNIFAEVRALAHLLSAHVEIAEWAFFSSVVQLQHASLALADVKTLAAVNINENKKKSRFSFFQFKSTHDSKLARVYQWLMDYFHLLLSKFTFYFYSTLGKYSEINDMRALSTETTCDFAGRCIHFLKKSDAECLFVVFNSVSLGTKCQFGHGYSHPNSGFRVPEDGIPSFPIILTFPETLDVTKCSYWSDVFSMLSKYTDKLTNSDTVFPLKSNMPVTDDYYQIYISCIEPRYYLVVVFEQKRLEKMAMISNFISDILSQGKYQKQFHALKSV
ncbi:uncharacterized protein TRIADDRAFT_58437 [Trichoplax adhaerens]|uniref:KICSTOR subunit 2 n=1 Tax=Trichoplax adhaerens TaxID=10228 RepID=B3S2A8_TRIAD|nr:hypothetical protein TRIADDRAFT_58437 [Trichoplax adhaerens]EDV23298.1 hypothetical protein TRIADDRAFT_58437 [Trichoplax adhaerens]|eukprot:XP_002114208.1 hypothetical protein TRIADDRAFT_58437 [Trichoplax adhaerens]